MSKYRVCSKCQVETPEISRIGLTSEYMCKKCADKLNNAGVHIIPVITFKSHMEEIDDALKLAKWNATGGYRLWCQYEGKDLSNKNRQLEEERRLEQYVKLRIEKELLSRGIFA